MESSEVLHRSEADEIANDLLYRTGKMLETGEAHWIKECFHLPHTIETSAGKRRLLSEESVIEVFQNLRKFYEQERVTGVIRTVVSAEPLAHDLIGSIHVAKLLRNDDSPYRSPYPVYSLIRKINGRWKIVSTLYAILDSSKHNELLCAEPDGDNESDLK